MMGVLPALVLSLGNYVIYRKISRSAGAEYTGNIGIQHKVNIGKRIYRKICRSAGKEFTEKRYRLFRKNMYEIYSKFR